MRKCIILSAVLLIASMSAAHAGGQAFISHFTTSSTTNGIGTSTTNVTQWRTVVYLSNITADPVTTIVTLYRNTNDAGRANVYVTTNLASVGNAEDVMVGPGSGGTASFTIRPYETATLSVRHDPESFNAYGKIEWLNDTENLVSLIGYSWITCVTRERSSTEHRLSEFSHSVPINNGLPF